MKFYCVTNIFDLQIFDNEATVLLFFKKVCTEMRFVSLFFLNQRNITASHLMTHLKCTVVHNAQQYILNVSSKVSLNSSSINKVFTNYGPSNMLLRFFYFFLYVYFNEAFVKNFMKKVSFLIQISKLHFNM